MTLSLLECIPAFGLLPHRVLSDTSAWVKLFHLLGRIGLLPESTWENVEACHCPLPFWELRDDARCRPSSAANLRICYSQILRSPCNIRWSLAVVDLLQYFPSIRVVVRLLRHNPWVVARDSRLHWLPAHSESSPKIWSWIEVLHGTIAWAHRSRVGYHIVLQIHHHLEQSCVGCPYLMDDLPQALSLGRNQLELRSLCLEQQREVSHFNSPLR